MSSLLEFFLNTIYLQSEYIHTTGKLFGKYPWWLRSKWEKEKSHSYKKLASASKLCTGPCKISRYLTAVYYDLCFAYLI